MFKPPLFFYIFNLILFCHLVYVIMAPFPDYHKVFLLNFYHLLSSFSTLKMKYAVEKAVA